MTLTHRRTTNSQVIGIIYHTKLYMKTEIEAENIQNIETDTSVAENGDNQLSDVIVNLRTRS